MNTSAISAESRKTGGKARRILLWVLIVVVVMALVAFLGIGFIAAESVTEPNRVFDPNNNPAAFNLQYEDVRLKSRGDLTDIAAWYVPSDENRRVIVLLHGRDASRTAGFDEGDTGVGHFTDFSAALHQAGFSVMLIDLRGHGESGPGQFSFGIRERNDVLAAVDWLAAKGYQPGKIGILGLSLGSAAGIGAASEDSRIGALVSDSGFADLNPLIQAQWKAESGLPKIFLYSTLWMIRLRYGFDIKTAKPVDEIGKIAPRPIFLIHCAEDELVPISHMEQLKAAAPSALTWVVPSCIHPEAYNADPAAYTEKVIGFFDAAIE